MIRHANIKKQQHPYHNIWKNVLTAVCLTMILVYATTTSAQTPREMRAAWVATVVNIDWPSSNTLSTPQQRQEMIAILDTLQSLHFNAIFIQVRPSADAFFESTHEPWSLYLTGKQGEAPTPFYDPLAFIVEEAHDRCIEVHAWINPYRAAMDTETKKLSATHPYKKHPEWFVKYGGKLYFNPALDEPRQHLKAVVADIVARYDIDAIHMDDYFYPYPVSGQEFPDKTLFKANPRGFNNIKDWRRDNVTQTIRELRDTIKATKPWVEFGISPFGVWRNQKEDARGSNTQAFTNYDGLYADILLWLKNGYIDYVVPQLYWEIGKKVADFAILLDWWSKNTYNTNLYIGLYASQLGNKNAAAPWRQGNEVIRQLDLQRSYPEVQGAALYSMVAIMDNRQGIRDSLRNSYFKTPTLVPANNKTIASRPPKVSHLKILKYDGQPTLSWNGGDAISVEKQPVKYVVYATTGKASSVCSPQNLITITADDCLNLKPYLKGNRGKMTFAIVAVNRYKLESAPAIINIKY
ncbi:MAG: family 10 glycosylhydrolase [Bacteroidales bacterium]|nr:family 10 glycosylhydrolase [Bacteroidales bacterium]